MSHIDGAIFGVRSRKIRKPLRGSVLWVLADSNWPIILAFMPRPFLVYPHLMKVRVRIEEVLEVGDFMTDLLIDGKKVSIGNGNFKFGKRNMSIIVERNMARRMGLPWKLLFHFPPYIMPHPNQSCIDELRV